MCLKKLNNISIKTSLILLWPEGTALHQLVEGEGDTSTAWRCTMATHNTPLTQYQYSFL
jgi:hypothetical protein